MSKRSSFPLAGFLILGVLSLAASAVFLVRAVVVEGTLERVLSAAVFGVFGALWLVAYWSSLRHPSD